MQFVAAYLGVSILTVSMLCGIICLAKRQHAAHAARPIADELFPVYNTSGAIIDYRRPTKHVVTIDGQAYTITKHNSAGVFARYAFG